MDHVRKLTTALQRRADANMAAFVNQARGTLVKKWGSIDFSAIFWPVRGRNLRSSGTKVERLWFTVSSDGYRTSQEGFPEPFGSFVRAVVLHRDARNARGMAISDHRCIIRACRYLFEHLKARGADPSQLLPLDFDAAAMTAKARELPKSSYQVGRKLNEVAQLMDRYALTSTALDWRNPIPCPLENGGAMRSRIGPAFDAQRAAKLPSDRILDALADLANANLEEPDLLRQRAVELLCCGGFRISELILMPRNCWVEEPQLDSHGNVLLDRNGKPVVRCGLRYFPAKGGHTIIQIKWLPTTLADVARRAVQDILRITHRFAELSRFMDDNPGKTLLGKPWDSYKEDHLLSMEQVARAVGSTAARLDKTGLRFCRLFSINIVNIKQSSVKGHSPRARSTQFVKKCDLVHALIHRSDLAPIVRHGVAAQPLHNTLFVVPIGYFHAGRFAVRGTVTTVTDENIDYYLNGCGKVKSIFGRLGYKDDDGNELSVTSHQFRHWLNTLAQEGGLSQHEIARWMGRRRIDQNSAYDHVTGRQLARKVFEKINGGQAEGPIARTAARLDPIRRQEFMASRVHTAHVTDIGICIFDWSMMPCPKHEACATCDEHLIEKGNSKQKEAAELLRVETAALIAIADAEQDDGTYGVDNWLLHHKRTLARLDQILAIHNDLSIPDGALVQLAADGTAAFQQTE